jgi:hypothetical protein
MLFDLFYFVCSSQYLDKQGMSVIHLREDQQVDQLNTSSFSSLPQGYAVLITFLGRRCGGYWTNIKSLFINIFFYNLHCISSLHSMFGQRTIFSLLPLFFKWSYIICIVFHHYSRCSGKGLRLLTKGYSQCSGKGLRLLTKGYSQCSAGYRREEKQMNQSRTIVNEKVLLGSALSASQKVT